jgi:hypothetical protein
MVEGPLVRPAARPWSARRPRGALPPVESRGAAGALATRSEGGRPQAGRPLSAPLGGRAGERASWAGSGTGAGASSEWRAKLRGRPGGNQDGAAGAVVEEEHLSATPLDPDDWERALAVNGLLHGPGAGSNVSSDSVFSERLPFGEDKASKRYLSSACVQRRLSDRALIDKTYEELMTYERGCVARMAEASRWSAQMGLRKKFNPIFVKHYHLEASAAAASGGGSVNFGSLSSAPRSLSAPRRHPGAGSGGLEQFLEALHRRPPLATAPTTSLHESQGELRCEVSTKGTAESRIMSVELFEREYDKLRARHREWVVEEQQRTERSTAAEAFRDAELIPLSGGAGAAPGRQGGAGAKAGSAGDETGGSAHQGDESERIERELCATLVETQGLADLLSAQLAKLRASGWA